MIKITLSGLMEKIKHVSGAKHDFEVANLLGMSASALSQHKARNSIPHSEVIQFCARYGCSLDTMYGISKAELEISARKYIGNNMPFCQNIQQVTSYLESNTIECKLGFECLDITGDNHIAIKWFENSMEPTIKNGEIVIVNLDKSKNKTNGIFLIFYLGQYLLRRFDFTFNNTVIIGCDNQMFKGFEVSFEKLTDIQIIGKAEKKIIIENV